jgi:hypothetical protein
MTRYNHLWRFITCSQTMAPQAPPALHNSGSLPLHYHRIEFRRLDGDDFQSHWQQWHRWMKYLKYMR